MGYILPNIIFWKRGVVLRINEAYEHEPILAYQGEEAYPVSGCNKIATQSVNVSGTMILTPGATAGTAVIACQGSPAITCETAADGSSCTLVVTQRVSVSVPIRYHVEVEAVDPTIACADGSTGSCGCC